MGGGELGGGEGREERSSIIDVNQRSFLKIAANLMGICM